jgi:outer membrane protein OmpA-like peptidoglycan-associated protein
MATTYLDLAETRGRQAAVEQETARLSSDAQMAGKNRTIAVRDRQIANRDELVAAQNHEIASQSRTLATRDADLANARAKLAESDMKVSDLGSTMVLQDVSFETGKSVLLAGGVNRLQPLINYLRLSPDTRVRIEGFTDSVGGTAYNQKLSLDRANSVRATLTSSGVDAGRIETLGSGVEKPLATNGTASGRQSNRRVEITLLKVSGT